MTCASFASVEHAVLIFPVGGICLLSLQVKAVALGIFLVSVFFILEMVDYTALEVREYCFL